MWCTPTGPCPSESDSFYGTLPHTQEGYTSNKSSAKLDYSLPAVSC